LMLMWGVISSMGSIDRIDDFYIAPHIR